MGIEGGSFSKEPPPVIKYYVQIPKTFLSIADKNDGGFLITIFILPPSGDMPSFAVYAVPPKPLLQSLRSYNKQNAIMANYLCSALKRLITDGISISTS